MINLIIIIIIILIVILIQLSFIETFDGLQKDLFDRKCVYLNATAAERALEERITRNNILIQQKSGVNFIEQPVGDNYIRLNDMKYNYDEDYGSMKSYVRNPKYYGIKAEIQPKQMIRIIRTLMKKYTRINETYQEVILDDADIVTYDMIKNKITNNISQISKVMSTKGFDELSVKYNKIQTNEPFIIFYDKLYYYGNSKNFSNYKFVTKIYRKGGEIYYNLYHDISYNYIMGTLHINNMNIMGISLEEDIHFGKYKKASLDMKNSNGVDCSMVESSECNTKFSTDKDYMKNRNNFLKSRKMEHQTNNEENLYKCFYKDAVNKNECESYELIKNENSFSTDAAKPGIWAKSRCTDNSECPYYKNNRNYKNNRGGCVNGKCELPINMKLLTPTIHDPNSKPLCHNCKNPEGKTGLNCLMCCEDQFKDSLYPNLESPDYAFEDDFNERTEKVAAEKLKSLGLSTHDLRC